METLIETIEREFQEIPEGYLEVFNDLRNLTVSTSAAKIRIDALDARLRRLKLKINEFIALKNEV